MLNTLEIGNGIFTISDIARILGIPYRKVNRWMSDYWNGKLALHYKHNYWIEDTKSVNFHTMIEIYVMMKFTEAGVNTNKIIEAHKELSQIYKTDFPFAEKKILDNIKTDKYKIYLQADNDIISLDASKQLNLELIKLFFKNLEFDNNTLVSRFYPLGKKHKIVCDPDHKFGQPTIAGTNIQTEVIFRLHKAGEPIPFIANIYDISEQEIKDVIDFHNKKVA